MLATKGKPGGSSRQTPSFLEATKNEAKNDYPCGDTSVAGFLSLRQLALPGDQGGAAWQRKSVPVFAAMLSPFPGGGRLLYALLAPWPSTKFGSAERLYNHNGRHILSGCYC